jgi:hypothetical protein
MGILMKKAITVIVNPKGRVVATQIPDTQEAKRGAKEERFTATVKPKRGERAIEMEIEVPDNFHTSPKRLRALHDSIEKSLKKGGKLGS